MDLLMHSFEWWTCAWEVTWRLFCWKPWNGGWGQLRPQNSAVGTKQNHSTTWQSWVIFRPSTRRNEVYRLQLHHCASLMDHRYLRALTWTLCQLQTWTWTQETFCVIGSYWWIGNNSVIVLHGLLWTVILLCMKCFIFQECYYKCCCWYVMLLALKAPNAMISKLLLKLGS